MKLTVKQLKNVIRESTGEEALTADEVLDRLRELSHPEGWSEYRDLEMDWDDAAALLDRYVRQQLRAAVEHVRRDDKGIDGLLSYPAKIWNSALDAVLEGNNK